jgi:hypothetical protein
MHSGASPAVQTARDVGRGPYANPVGLARPRGAPHPHYSVAARLKIPCMPLGTGLRPRSHRRVSAIRSRTRINPDGRGWSSGPRRTRDTSGMNTLH